MIANVETENGSFDPDHTSLSARLSSFGSDLIQSTCMQNLTIVALAAPEISLGAPKFKVGHVTLTAPPVKGDL